MFAGSSDDSDSSIESECCFKAIDALKKASRENGLLYGTLIFKEDGTLKYKLEEKKHNKYELYVTLKGPIGTPYEGFDYEAKISSSEKFLKNPGKEANPPTIYFVDPIYHPNVSPSGQVSIKGVSQMKAENNRVETYVAFLNAMLRDPDISDNCNAEAG